ncbi:MAG: Hsp70 family protein [Ferruginibacter sp.]
MAKIGINLATGSLQQEEIIVGIDLGTTNSLIAIIHPDTRKAVALREHDSSSIVPSVIYFDPEGNVTVGEAAKEFLITAPKRTVFSAKRLLGKNYTDIQQNASFFPYNISDNGREQPVTVKVDDHYYSPLELSSWY